MDFIKKLLSVVLPFGRKRLFGVLFLAFVQGLLQAMSIFSIVPFLSIANNPESFKDSNLGSRVLPLLPDIMQNDIVLFMGIITLFLIIFSSIINGAGDYIRSKYANILGVRIGTHLLSSYAFQPYMYHLRNNPTELLKRVQSDLYLFISCVLKPLIDVFSRTINILFILLLLVIINPVITAITIIIFLSLTGITAKIFRKSMIRGSSVRNVLLSKKFQASSQLLFGIKTISILNKQKFFIKKYKKASEGISNIDSFTTLASSAPKYFIEAIAFSSIVSLVIYLNSASIPLETVLPLLILFVMSAYRILPALQLIYSQINQVQSHMFSLDMLYNDLSKAKFKNSKEIKPVDTSMKFDISIVFSNVSFAYSDNIKPSISNLNLTIVKGSKIGVVGSSGAGKSTFIDLLISSLDPVKGEILIDNAPINVNNKLQWQKIIGYVPQDIFLVDDSVRNNIALGLDDSEIDENMVIQAAKVAQIYDFIISEMPDGFNTICGERGVRLSGGQRQRIALARALYYQPQVLVFDEATSALDNKTENSLIKAIEALPDYFTIITIAHRLTTIKNCDMIYVFDHGEIVDQGKYEYLKYDSTAFQRLSINNLEIDAK